MSDTVRKAWRQSSLIGLADYHNGAAFNPKYWADSGLPIIRIEQINDPSAPTDLYSGPLSPLNRIGDGDLVFSWSATLKAVLWKHGPGALNQHLFKVVPKFGVDKEFLFHILDYNMERIASGSHGSTMKHITRKELQRYKVVLPVDEDHQRRIATILTTMDEEIEATEALIAKHQQIKAGLMHDLFTRGLWTQAELARGDHKGLPCEATAQEGQLRPTPEEAPGLYQETPLGLIPHGWHSKQLPEVVDFWDGKRIPLKEDDRAEMEGDIPYYGASGIIDWIDRWLFDDELILLGEDGENIISRNLPLAFKVVGKCWVNNHAHVMKPKSGQSIDYWTNYLEWRDYSRMTSGSAQPKITQSHLSRMHVAKPSEGEQAAIATRMDAIHFLIAEETTHLAKLRQQKQGLMHDLLTGRVRVDALSSENLD